VQLVIEKVLNRKGLLELEVMIIGVQLVEASAEELLVLLVEATADAYEEDLGVPSTEVSEEESAESM
jgi:hypothetical protein